VGTREAVDRRKDRLLREVGWQVIRVRCGKLQPLGPHDVVASGVTDALIERLLDELRLIRGGLFVDAYLA
jgi:very-short-patch-repair endonuclease